MEKIIHSGSFQIDEPTIQLMDVHSRGVDKSWMHKRAAVLTDEIDRIRPEKGKTFVHLIALGDGERYGANRNGDYFSKAANEGRHHTFVKYGQFYRHHRNKDPKKRQGEIKLSAYNAPMGRVELVIAAHNDKCPEFIEKVANDEQVPVSMACKVAYDVCSICKNEAPSRDEYCKHASDMMGMILEDGRQVYVDNPNPTHFDISEVFRPADRIAYGLRKVAAAGASALSGAELAEIEGLIAPAFGNPHLIPKGPHSAVAFQKKALLGKLSEIEKQIDAVARGIDFNGHGSKLVQLAGGIPNKDLLDASNKSEDKEALHQQSDRRMQSLMGALAQARVSLPVDDFLKIVLGQDAEGINVDDVKSHLPGIYTRMQEDGDCEVCEDGTYDPAVNKTDVLPQCVKDAVSSMVPGMSLADEPVQRRVTIIAARKLPKPQLNPAPQIRSIKMAAEDTSAALAREYAKYKLSLLSELCKQGSSQLSLGLSVLQNFV